MQTTDFLYRMGTIDRDLWQSEMGWAAGHVMDNPGVKQWWDAGGKTQLAPQFVESTESEINVWA